MATLVVVSPYAPSKATPHAGGQYVYHHLVHLARMHDVTLLAPATSENVPAGAAATVPWQVVLFPVEGSEQRSIAVRFWRYGQYVCGGLGPGPRSFRGLLRSGAALDRLRTADLVELQYGTSLAWLPLLRQLGIAAPVTVICHDVYAQAMERRRASAATIRERIEAALLLQRIRRQEPRLINRCAKAFVFSEKDRRLLVEAGVKTDVQVISPLVLRASASPRRSPARRAVFVAAFARPANQEAARWLLEQVWPAVQDSCPAARLSLVGAGVPAWLSSLAEQTGAVVTGFVPDLEPYYRSSRVALAPLLSGAGVKFKVLDALAQGVPVAATPIGAEGLACPVLPFVRVASSAAEFSRAVVDLLEDDDPDIGRRAASATDAAYSFAASMTEILRQYDALLPAGSGDPPPDGATPHDSQPDRAPGQRALEAAEPAPAESFKCA